MHLTWMTVSLRQLFTYKGFGGKTMALKQSKIELPKLLVRVAFAMGGGGE